MSFIPRKQTKRRRRSGMSLAASFFLIAASLAALTAGTGKARAAMCGTADVAQGRPATASSLENASFPAANAVDGNLATRWSSAFADPQWLTVDLGSAQPLCQVTLTWETAYARAFQIQASTDNTTWTTSYSATNATGGTQALPLTATGRYLRIYGTTRATQWGYSLWELQIYTTTTNGGTGCTSG